MDPLLAEAIERHRQESPRDRLLEALQVMSDGIALKLGNLRRQHPDLSEDDLQARLQSWLER